MSDRVYVYWIKACCLFVVLLGILSLAASHSITAGPWLFLMDLLSWPLDNNPAVFQKESFALNAVLGGMMIGWGSFMYLLSDQLLADASKKLKRAYLISIGLWYFTDSLGSLTAGLPGNVLLNTISLVLFLVPLFKIRSNPAA